jgi:hypothetical protein
MPREMRAEESTLILNLDHRAAVASRITLESIFPGWAQNLVLPNGISY